MVYSNHFSVSEATSHLEVALTAFENELGVQAPVGFWDPAGFTADGSTENFARRRQTELKHGRISMLDAWSMFGKTLTLCLLLREWYPKIWVLLIFNQVCLSMFVLEH